MGSIFSNAPQGSPAVWRREFQEGRRWRPSRPDRSASWSCTGSEQKFINNIFMITTIMVYDKHHYHLQDDMITQLIKTRSLTYHDVDCSSSHRIGSANTDHLRDERTEADSRLAHWGWEHLHGLLSRRIKWKQRENNKNVFFHIGRYEEWEIEIRHTHTQISTLTVVYIGVVHILRNHG